MTRTPIKPSGPPAPAELPPIGQFLKDQTIRIDQVAALTAMSPREVWRAVSSDPSFPRPLKKSARVTIWIRSEVEAWAKKKTEELLATRT